MFSGSEHKLLKILGRRKMTISELTEEFYSEISRPINGNNSVAQIVRKINEKCDFWDLKFKLNGEGTGRGGRTVWKVKV
jgi:hypothetical protein